MSPGGALRSRGPFLAVAVAATALLSWLPLAPIVEPLLSLDAFRALGEPRIRGLFLRTLAHASGSASIAVLLGLPLAVIATRTSLPGASLLGLLLPLPLFLPPLLYAQAWHGLTGMDGPWASIFTLGACYAPFPALFAARALARQGPGAHEAALLCGGRGFALREMLASAWPATLLGAALAFLFCATDFAVPDYYAWVGDKFSVYAAEVFNRYRDQDFRNGASAAAPLVLLAAIALYAVLSFRDRSAVAEQSTGRAPARLALGSSAPLIGLLALAIVSVLLLVPIAELVYETGKAGPGAAATWSERSTAAFADAVERGRGDLGRSLVSGLAAGAIVLVLAPFWAHLFASGRPSAWRRLLTVLLALPLLTPAMGFGLGAILVFNRDLFYDLYEGPAMPPLVLAGRFLPIAVFLLVERLQRVPREQEEVAALAGVGYLRRLFVYRMGPQRAAWFLSAGLVAVFAVRELDLAILIPAANASAAVRYYNALHFARDNFVAAFGLLIALVLFLPIMLHAAWQGLTGKEDRA